MVLSLDVGRASVGTRGQVSKRRAVVGSGGLAFEVLGAVRCCGLGCEIVVLRMGRETHSGDDMGDGQPSWRKTPKVQLNFLVRRAARDRGIGKIMRPNLKIRNKRKWQ